jgi:predicted  nucleic acid-binding Zn-ribbon protein
MYGDPSALEEYNGERTFDVLSEFAKENLVTLCSPSNLDLCDEETKAHIESYLSKPKEEVQTLIEEEEKKLKEAQDKFDAEVQALQDKYAALEQEKDEAVAAVKDGGLGLMRSVLKAKENGFSPDEKDEL